MAQVGSYVPADAVTLTPLDAVYTRMGAEDNIFKKESTFMHELNEASHILRSATKRSLVIMDELGRGTSTHDGVAIAHATCSHLVNVVKCLTLFVTHYPSIAELAAPADTSGVDNFHMSFIENRSAGDGVGPATAITFLYKLVQGAAARSYGLNVARLACVPEKILTIAAHKSSVRLPMHVITSLHRSLFCYCCCCCICCLCCACAVTCRAVRSLAC
jgi:DNA mismatch repair protein MSH3